MKRPIKVVVAKPGLDCPRVNSLGGNHFARRRGTRLRQFAVGCFSKRRY